MYAYNMQNLCINLNIDRGIYVNLRMRPKPQRRIKMFIFFLLSLSPYKTHKMNGKHTVQFMNII